MKKLISIFVFIFMIASFGFPENAKSLKEDNGNIIVTGGSDYLFIIFKKGFTRQQVRDNFKVFIDGEEVSLDFDTSWKDYNYNAVYDYYSVFNNRDKKIKIKKNNTIKVWMSPNVKMKYGYSISEGTPSLYTEYGDRLDFTTRDVLLYFSGEILTDKQRLEEEQRLGENAVLNLIQ